MRPERSKGQGRWWGGGGARVGGDERGQGGGQGLVFVFRAHGPLFDCRHAAGRSQK